MSTEYVSDTGVLVPESRGLSQVERLVNTFISPSKTFQDILRNTSWWLPFLLIAVLALSSTYVVDKQVGFDRVSENQVRQSPKAMERMATVTPEQRAQQMAMTSKITKATTYSFPLLLLITLSIYALFVWASFNFGLGATTTFGQVFAVTWYAALPYLVTSLLGIITVYFGGNAEGYDIKNPVGTNLAYYMPDAAPWFKALLSSLDLIKIWSDVLMVIGMSIVAKKTILQSAIIVGLLWFLGVLVSLAGAAFGG